MRQTVLQPLSRLTNQKCVPSAALVALFARRAATSGSALRGDRAPHPQLKGPDGVLPRGARDSQGLADTVLAIGDNSTHHQIVAPFRLAFADSLFGTRAVAARLRVST